jgi:integrase/recombinase XerC
MDQIDIFLHWCKMRGLRDTYRADLRCTLRRLERAVPAPWMSSESTLRAWWERLEIGAGTRATYAAHLSSFYGWLVAEGHRPDNPTVRLVRPKIRRRQPRPIGDDRLAHAIANAGPTLRVWLLLAAYMGARACEVARLHADDVDLQHRTVVLHGKGGKTRIVPLHPQVAAALPATDGYFFPGRAGNDHVLPNTVSTRANHYLHGLGISETFHQCRHWFGTNVYRQSLDLRLTQELMGHEDPATTAGYAKWSPERAAAVLDALPTLTA